MESISAAIVRQTAAFRISRVVVKREPMLGALVTAGTSRQTRYVERGGLVVGPPHKLEVLGPGHAFDVEPNDSFLYLPLATKGPLVEWVLAVDTNAAPMDIPEVRRIVPPCAPVAIPLEPPKHDSLYPDWAVPWLGVPADVGTWASAIGIRGTSLAQRLSRLVNESPKRILSAARATIAFELAAHYRGEGAAHTIDTDYAALSQLPLDLRDRFDIPWMKLFVEDPIRELEWLRLVKSLVR